MAITIWLSRFHEKTKELIRIDDEQTLVLQTDLTTPAKNQLLY